MHFYVKIASPLSSFRIGCGLFYGHGNYSFETSNMEASEFTHVWALGQLEGYNRVILNKFYLKLKRFHYFSLIRYLKSPVAPWQEYLVNNV